MKYISQYFIILLFVVSCETDEEEESSFSTSGNSASVKQEVIDTNQFYLGTYKGTLTNKQANKSGIILIEIISDSSIYGLIRIDGIEDTLPLAIPEFKNRIYTSQFTNGTYSGTFKVDYLGNNPLIDLRINSVFYQTYLLKESPEDSVYLYTGSWADTIYRGPLVSPLIQTGLWNFAHNSKTLVGSNGEDKILGNINNNKVFGTHANGSFSGNISLKDELSGPFEWKAFGASGTGTWVSKRALLSNE